MDTSRNYPKQAFYSPWKLGVGFTGKCSESLNHKVIPFSEISMVTLSWPPLQKADEMQKYCKTVEENISPNISCKSPGTLTPWQVGFHFSTCGLLLRKVEGFPGGTVLRICLPMQGTRVWALVWEDPTCRGATRPTKPVSYNYWARASGACAPQQERPR